MIKHQETEVAARGLAAIDWASREKVCAVLRPSLLLRFPLGDPVTLLVHLSAATPVCLRTCRLLRTFSAVGAHILVFSLSP